MELTQIINQRTFDNYLSIKSEMEKLIDKKMKKTITKTELGSLEHLKKIIGFDFSQPSRSISFGNTIFGGIFRDSGASVFSYFSKNQHSIFYALKINKFSYRKKSVPLEDVQLLFVVSPLSTLVSLQAYGEFFHSRSKSYYMLDQKIKKALGVQLVGQFIDNAGYLLIPGNPIEMNAKLSDYIAKNAVILRPTDKKEADELIQGQKDVTALFKAMDAIYKYAKRDEKLLK